jgi:hypothetical protein
MRKSAGGEVLKRLKVIIDRYNSGPVIEGFAAPSAFATFGCIFLTFRF